MTVLEGDELCATDTGDGLGATTAALGEEFPVAVATERLLLLGGEFLPGQQLVAVCAGETLAMPRRVLVADASLVDHITTLGTPLGVVILVALHTDYALISRNEALVSDRLAALGAGEALIMPLLALVLKFLHTSAERFTAAVTPGRKVVVMAVGAVDFLILGSERLVHQRLFAAAALEAELVPVALFVRQVLVVGPDGLGALLTVVSKELLVAGYTVGVLFLEDVAAGHQLLVAVPAGQVLLVEVLLHGFGVLLREDQLYTHTR